MGHTPAFKILLRIAVISALFGQAPCQTHGGWAIETLSHIEGNTQSFSAFAIDQLGNLHLAYTDRKGRELKYGFRAVDGKQWDTAVVDPTGAAFVSIAVNKVGEAHIAYNSPYVQGLHYAVWDGVAWRKTLIDPAKIGHSTSIQLDSKGNPQITYFREDFSDRRSAQNLKFARFDGINWFIQTVDHRSGTGRWNAIGLDQHDRPFISYSLARFSGGLGFAFLKDSDWEHSVIEAEGSNAKSSLPGASSLAFDSADRPHLAYIDAGSRTINYAWRDGQVWHQEFVDSLVSVGSDLEQISLQLDRSGRPHIAYYDPGTGALKYAVRNNGIWRTEIVDDGGAGEFATLGLDREDRAYIVYSAPLAKELRIAHRLTTQAAELR